MPTWTINGQTIAALQGANVVRELRNMDVDRVTFSRVAAADAADLFAYDADVAVLKDALPWFRGRAGREPSQGDPDAEGKAIEILGPWEQLSRLTYQQRWMGGAWVPPPGGGDDVWTPGWQYRSRLILGQSEAGAAQTVGAIIREVIAYAASCGVTVSAGIIDDGPYIPWDEVLDITCADAIRRVTRWLPDCVGWYDYSTAVPTFNFRPASALTATTLAVGGILESVNLTRMGARAVPAVLLKYETSEDVDGTVYRGMIEDKYPAAATGAEIGAMIQTIQLSGGSQQTQRQHVTSRRLPGFQNKPELLAWFLEKCPQFADPNNAAIIDANKYPDFDFSITHSAIYFPRELREGSLQDWMRSTIPDPSDPDVRINNPDRVYDYNDLDAVVTYSLTYTQVDAQDNVVRVAEHEKVAISVMTTDCPTGWYVRRVVTPAETPPSGLAQAIYDALNAVHYAGSVTLVEEECSGAISMGCRLSITGGASGWASARMIVQSITERLDSGQTSIEVGPPGHLSPRDLLDIRYCNRARRPADGARTRTGGQETGRQIDQSSAYPMTVIRSAEGSWGDRVSLLEIVDGQARTRMVRVTHAEDPGPLVPFGLQLDVVTAERYDPSTDQLQVKTRKVTVLAAEDESDWTMIEGGQASACP
jgi:hypothetical protein